MRPTFCKHCDRPAEWKWQNPDEDDFSYICQRCMTIVSFYADKPLRQFIPLRRNDSDIQADTIHG